MPDLPPAQQCPCGACFEAGAKVVEERFSDDAQAFGRFTLLFNAGDSPALCRKDNLTYYVCHRDQPPHRRPWPSPPRTGG